MRSLCWRRAAVFVCYRILLLSTAGWCLLRRYTSPLNLQDAAASLPLKNNNKLFSYADVQSTCNASLINNKSKWESGRPQMHTSLNTENSTLNQTPINCNVLKLFIYLAQRYYASYIIYVICYC